MKTDFSGYLALAILVFQCGIATSCSGRPGKNPEPAGSSPAVVPGPASAKLFTITTPADNATYRLKDNLKVSLDVTVNDKKPDSIIVNFDSKPVACLTMAPWECPVPAASMASTGRKSLRVSAWRSGKPVNSVTRFITVVSDVTPKRYGYSVVHTYPHDPEAFTQGLVYEKGKMFEGTGQKSGSSLREVDLHTGKVIRQHDLDASLFGEGIALYHDRIYQVTWENQVGFIYDKATFNVINKIYYSTQGWGLATVGDRIVMSDGTNVLAFYDPEMFTIVSRIEVYDNEKMVESLNELEYINGEIWANIWMTDRIARIDPSSGKVLGYVDLKGILPESDKTPETDVLNGIAWDAEGKRIFVTGKRWPKLFEIRITE